MRQCGALILPYMFHLDIYGKKGAQMAYTPSESYIPAKAELYFCKGNLSSQPLRNWAKECTKTAKVTAMTAYVLHSQPYDVLVSCKLYPLERLIIGPCLAAFVHLHGNG